MSANQIAALELLGNLAGIVLCIWFDLPAGAAGFAGLFCWNIWRILT